MRRTRITTAAILFGAGLGGLLDGIVFHQILQWHSMLSNVLPAMEDLDAMRRSMRADGWFHLLMWAVTLAGLLGLWSAFRAPGRMPSTAAFFGSVLMGWGAFNLIEGIVNHFILALHHVRDVPVGNTTYDWALLIAGGIGFMLIGFALRDAPDPGPVSADRRSGQDRRLGMSDMLRE